jgi:uncharacterized protein YjdB
MVHVVLIGKELSMERGALLFSSLQPDDSLPALTSCARLISLSILICSAAFGQGQGLSITNYQLVSAQTIQRTLNVTYRADLVNTGTALEAVTAIVTSLNPTVQVVARQDALQFASVPANSQVTSINTFTLQIDFNVPVDFSQLQWTFQTAGILLPANVTVTPGATVNFPVTLGTAAPPGGVLITLASSNPATATVSPSSFFVSQGMTSPRGVTTVTGNNAGSATITASAPGYATANGQVLVTSGGTSVTMSFWPGSLTINETATQNLTLNLSAPAPAGLVVNLSSSNATVATAPATVSFGTGTTSVSVLVTGVAAGSVTITASAPNVASATASVTVTQLAPGGIILPGNVTLAPGDTVNFPITLGTAAPAGGVLITLGSSDPSIAIVLPSNFLIPEGVTSARRTVTTVSGISAGSATITASASGYPTASAQVQVTGGGTTTTMSFSPASLTINGIATQNLTLNLSAPAPAGLVVNLSSSNATVATVPATVSFGTGMNSVSVPVTGVAAGSVTITASAPNVASATASVTVTQPAAGGIILPGNVTLAPGDTVNFPITLGTAAPAGGVLITLASSDPSIAIVLPSNFLIPEGVTSARRTVTTVSGISAGSATITASAFGYPTASAQVQVTGGGTTPTTMSFSPVSLIATQNLTLNLSAPAPAGLVVNLSSSNATVATVPATVSFGTGTTSVSVLVTGVAAGSVTITASAPNIASATASVTVTQPAAGTILLPASTTVGLNQSVSLQVTLPAPAPADGVTVSLASSDTSTATVTPSVFIAARTTFPATQPQVSGIKLGSASITASAPGFTPGTTQVQVNAGGGSSYFTPVFGLTIIEGSTQDLTLNLVPAPASGLTVSLSSSNTSVATVPATVTYLANSGAVTIPVPVTGVAAGSATITASTPSFGTATSNVTVTSLNGASVTWYGACWATLTLNGYTGNFQGMDFALSTPVPVAVQGSLFFTPNCDPSQGIDNMNDSGTLTGSTHMVQGFSRHPDTIPSSAMYWIGTATTFGTCPPGSLCSGCVTYTKTTPNCSIMP